MLMATLLGLRDRLDKMQKAEVWKAVESFMVSAFALFLDTPPTTLIEVFARSYCQVALVLPKIGAYVGNLPEAILVRFFCDATFIQL